MTSVVVFDYGSGNLRSAERAMVRAGADVTITKDLKLAGQADGLVVPGVGAFAACMRALHAVRGGTVMWDRLRHGRPVLAICVGMQVLFERGVEHGEASEGLGIVAGDVIRLTAPVVPHMGWNTVSAPAGSLLFDGVADERFYFVHSYAPHSAPDCATTTAQHGDDVFVAALERGVLSATQFHPEKSGDAGAHLLENWVRSL